MNRILIILTCVCFATASAFAEPLGSKQGPAAVPVQDDELPDGELDLPDGDFDEPDPADVTEPEPEPDPDQPDPEVTPEEPVTEPEPEPEPEDILAPPDERNSGDTGRAPLTAEPADPEPWIDEDLVAESNRRPVTELEANTENGGRIGDDEQETPLVENPLFWGGVGGGVLAVAAAGGGIAFLVYTLLNADKGNIAITVE